VGPTSERRKGYALPDFEPVWRRYLVDPDPNPRNPRNPHGRAKNEPSQSAHREGECADMDNPQTRMVEPSARNARIEGGKRGIESLIDTVMAEGGEL
jgi:hypothetical protein